MTKQVKLLVNLRHDEMLPVGTVFTEPFPAFIQHEIDHCPDHVVVTDIAGVVAAASPPDPAGTDDNTPSDDTGTKTDGTKEGTEGDDAAKVVDDAPKDTSTGVKRK